MYIHRIGVLVLLAAMLAGCCGISCPETVLELDDEHTSVWMSIDNGYTYDSSSSWEKWSGVLFQLGYYWEYDSKEQVQKVAEFDSVIFVGEKGKLALQANEFTWINVVSEHATNTEPPVSREDADILFPNSWSQTHCDDTALVATVPAPCLRMRSLHAFFRPERILTYWQGSSGYSALAREGDDEHNKYYFWLNDEVSVQVWKETEEQLAINTKIQSLGELEEIRLEHKGNVNHGEMHNPPVSWKINP
jgi:hypothetical protein